MLLINAMMEGGGHSHRRLRVRFQRALLPAQARLTLRCPSRPAAGRYAGGGKENVMELLHGDCLELLDGIADESVDMVLLDPPYSSGGLFAGAERRRQVKNTQTTSITA